MTEAIASLATKRASLRIGDLGTEIVQLSYIDAPTAIELLKGFGVTTFAMPSEIPTEIDWSKLPYVVLIPDPTGEETGLVGGTVTGGAFGLTMVPNTATALSSKYGWLTNNTITYFL